MMYKSQFQKIDPYDWFCGPDIYIYKMENLKKKKNPWKLAEIKYIFNKICF